MERDLTPFLRLLDYMVVAAAAGVTALLTGYLIPSGWPLPAGMLAGMMLGVPVLVAAILGLSWIANAFEIIMPGMPSVMIVGMYGGMAAVNGNSNLSTLLIIGVCVGLSIQAVFHIYDLSLHGEAGPVRNDMEK
ncbi:MAG: hypothetical protein ACE5EN_11150 [Nitrospinota bacterium]